MEAVIGLLLVLLQLSFGVEHQCDGREKNTQCYAVLGGFISIKLIDKLKENTRYYWKLNTSIILTVSNKTVRPGVDHFNIDNGSFTINPLMQNYSGQYNFSVFEDGTEKEQRILHLSVQAPVTSVQLHYECLNMGQRNVSCSSDGDSPLYSWTQDGRPLNGSKNSNTILLDRETRGKVTCHVQNNVSSSSGELTLPTCGYIFVKCSLSNGTNITQWVFEKNNTLCVDPTALPGGKNSTVDSLTVTSSNGTSSRDERDLWTVTLVGISLSALVFILLMALVVICVQKKKSKKSKDQQDEQELTYAVVKVVQRPEGGAQEVHRSEEEVEYGQVNFSQQPRRVQVPPDDCVYARVSK